MLKSHSKITENKPGTPIPIPTDEVIPRTLVKKKFMHSFMHYYKFLNML